MAVRQEWLDRISRASDWNEVVRIQGGVQVINWITGGNLEFQATGTVGGVDTTRGSLDYMGTDSDYTPRGNTNGGE